MTLQCAKCDRTKDIETLEEFVNTIRFMCICGNKFETCLYWDARTADTTLPLEQYEQIAHDLFNEELLDKFLLTDDCLSAIKRIRKSIIEITPIFAQLDESYQYELKLI